MNSGILFGSFPTLSSSSLVLRKIVVDDIDDVYAIYSNGLIFEYCGIIAKNNKVVVLKSISHFERDFKKKTRMKWGIALNGRDNKLMGIIEAMDLNPNVNKVTIGYFLHPDYWHKGYSTEAVRILVHFLFKKAGVNRIQAEVMPANTHSKKVLLKNRFVLEGTLRQATIWPGKGIVDLEMYSILASDPWQKLDRDSE